MQETVLESKTSNWYPLIIRERDYDDDVKEGPMLYHEKRKY